MADNIIAQPGWHWCNQCGNLWHGSSALPDGFCAATKPPGGKHSAAGSGDYALFDKPAAAFKPTIMAQPQWRWCNKCDCLWHPQSAHPGVCPAGGDHSETGSGDYTLLNDSSGSIG